MCRTYNVNNNETADVFLLLQKKIKGKLCRI